MTHPLVDQLRFTRREWLRGLEYVTEADAQKHFGQMNCISWTVGHLAWQEHRYWLERAQGQVLFPVLNEQYAYGAPMTTPALADSLVIWQQVTRATNQYLDSLTIQSLQDELRIKGRVVGQTIGTGMQRIIYHYWYHIGEIQAIRQMLGHGNLPEYVGEIEAQAPYRPE
jgi:hypothetical protein